MTNGRFVSISEHTVNCLSGLIYMGHSLHCDGSKTFYYNQHFHCRTIYLFRYSCWLLTCAGCGIGRGGVLKVSLPKVEIALWNLGVRVSCLGEQGVAFLFEFANSLTCFPRTFSFTDECNSFWIMFARNVQHCEM